MSENAGTIGGVSFWELPGSPDFNITDDDASATRMLRVSWDDVDTLISKLTTVPFSSNTQLSLSSSTSIYHPWGTDVLTRVPLMVKSINVKPAWNGRQANIAADTRQDEGYIATYGKADVTITYGLEVQDKYRSTWEMGASFTQSGGQFSYAATDVNDMNPSLDEEQIGNAVQIVRPEPEITTRIRISEVSIPDENAGKLRDIANLVAAERAIGTINSDTVIFYFGAARKSFPAGQVLFYSWEVEPSIRFGKRTHEVVYHFKIFWPPYKNFGIGLQGDDNDATDHGQILTWNYEHYPEGTPPNDYRLVTPVKYQSSDFRLLFPWTVR